LCVCSSRSFSDSIVIRAGLTSLFRTTFFELTALEQPTSLLEQFARGRILRLAVTTGVVVVIAGVSTIATSLLLAGAAGADAVVLVAACAGATSVG
jgi:hypothetical protein